MTNRLEDSLENGYKVHIKEYLNFAWQLFGAYASPYVMFTILYCMTYLLSQQNNYFSIINIFALPCLTAGFFLATNKAYSGKSISFRDFFEGFKFFKDLTIFNIIISLSMLALVYPIQAYLVKIIMVFTNSANKDPLQAVNEIVNSLPFWFKYYVWGILICYLLISVLTLFSIHAIIFRKLNAFQAIQFSARVVMKNFFGNFLFLVVIGITLICGFMVMFIGIIPATVIALISIHAAYLDIVGIEIGETEIES